MMFGKKRSTTENQGNTMLHKKLNFAATEAYKLLRTNLAFTLPDEKKCRVVGITSSIRSEGKSTTAVNLSYVLAETGKRVLLIDADLRLPSVAKKMEIRCAPGLSNVIAGVESEENAIWISEQTESWAILPAGDIPPNPTEMLASSQMVRLIERLSASYDFIIIDLPPVNIVSDALVVSSILDGMIVVVRDNYSGRREINNCMRQLKLSGVKILGFLMNTTSDGQFSYGKYRYYKRYGQKYGYGYAKPSSEASTPYVEPDNVSDESVDEAWFR